MQLYYHKTTGGAEYLTDNYVLCPNGHKEGSFDNSKYIVRIDGDITKDAELTVKEPEGWSDCNHYATNEQGLCSRCGYNTKGITQKELKTKEPDVIELVNRYSSDILDIIDDADEFTRRYLQGAVSVIVRKIINELK